MLKNWNECKIKHLYKYKTYTNLQNQYNSSQINYILCIGIKYQKISHGARMLLFIGFSKMPKSWKADWDSNVTVDSSNAIRR